MYLTPWPCPKNPPPILPESVLSPLILLMALFLKMNGYTAKTPSAAINPNGHGNSICKPMLMVSDTKIETR